MKPNRINHFWIVSTLFVLIALPSASWGQAAAPDPFDNPPPAPSPFDIPADPAPGGGSVDPFGGGGDVGDDPFGGSSPPKPPAPGDDPFGEPEPPADPFGAGDDPFAGPEDDNDRPPRTTPDPFGGPALPVTPPTIEISPLKAPDDWNPRTAEKKILEALVAPTRIETIEVPLQDMLDHLAELHNIEIQIDNKALCYVGIDPSTPITKDLKGITLRSALKLILRELELAYVIQGEVLLITTPEEAEHCLITRVYPVTDLLYRDDEQGDISRYDADSLVDMFTAVFHHQNMSWSEARPGSITAMPIKNGMTLVVSQTRDFHETIERILQLLRRVNKAEKLPVSIPVQSPSYIKAEQKIIEALDSKTQVDMIDVPLIDVVDFLSEFHDIEVIIDNKALNDMGIDPSAEVTCDLKEISLRSALRLILRELGLTYTIEDEVLLITTPEEAETQLPLRIYPVTDIVRYKTTDGGWAYDVDWLAELITSIVAPSCWPCQSGPPPIDYVVLSDSAAIVIPQTWEIHEELEMLLRTLRKIARTETLDENAELIETANLSKLSRGVSNFGPAERQTIGKLEEALVTPVTVEATELPLTELIDLLAEKTKVPIVIDGRSLCDAGIDPATPVTCDFDGINLRSVLRLLLRNCDLAYVIRDESIVITTPEEAETVMEVRFYPITDLALFKQKEGPPFPDVDSLTRMMTRAVQPKYWAENGGPGSWSEFHLPTGTFLAVSQTRDIQKEVASLLLKVRKMNEQKKDSPPVFHREPEPPSGGMF